MRGQQLKSKPEQPGRTGGGGWARLGAPQAHRAQRRPRVSPAPPHPEKEPGAAGTGSSLQGPGLQLLVTTANPLSQEGA